VQESALLLVSSQVCCEAPHHCGLDVLVEKAIFEKFGVRSRRELVGQLFAQQYKPQIEAGRGLDANGWFT
jgi:hypothetical protein